MSANLMGFYTTVSALAKSNTEAASARSARVASVVQDGYRRWFDGVSASVGETVRFAGEFTKVRSQADLVALQREVLETASARVAGDLKAFIELSNKLVAEVTTPVAAPVAAAPAPKAEVKVEVKVEAPKAEVKVEAPKVEVKAEVKVEAPKVEAPKAEAPKVEVKAEAPKAEAAKVEPKAAPQTEAKAEAAPVAPATAPAAAE